MTPDPFTERLARVRQRFVSTLEGKIDDAYAALPKLTGDAPAAALVAGEAYRTMHGIVGVGPTVGFPATGRAARAVEDVLRQPQQDKRCLAADEIAVLEDRLAALREAVTRELQAFHAEVFHSA
jgi:HPt (histidine-containing phosphotransfer) domain-containing protein